MKKYRKYDSNEGYSNLKNTMPLIKLKFETFKNSQKYSSILPTVMFGLEGDFQLLVIGPSNIYQKIKFSKYDLIILDPKYEYILTNHLKKSVKIILIEIFTLDEFAINYLQKLSLEKLKSVHQSSYYWILRDIWKMINPNDLYLLVGTEKILWNMEYSLRGPSKFILTLAECSYGEGPQLYYHNKSVEIYVVISGKFQVQVDDEIFYLSEGEIVEIQPGSLRKFQNMDFEKGYILPIVLGVNNESDNIIFPSIIREELTQKISLWKRPLLHLMEWNGLKFT